MSNPNPTTTGKVIKPKVRSTDILVWIVKQNITDDKGRVIATSRIVAEEFWKYPKKRLAEASCRLLTLRKWGCLKVKVANKGREDAGEPYQRHKEYYVTDWGFEMAKKWKHGAPRWRKRIKNC